jgi:hypothetical protein
LVKSRKKLFKKKTDSKSFINIRVKHNTISNEKKYNILLEKKHYLQYYFLNIRFNQKFINKKIVKILTNKIIKPYSQKFNEIEKFKKIFIKKLLKINFFIKYNKMYIKNLKRLLFNMYTQQTILMDNKLYTQYKILEQLVIQNYQIFNKFNLKKINNKLKIDFMENSNRYYLNEGYLRKHNYFNDFIVNSDNNLMTGELCLQINLVKNLKKKLKKLFFIYNKNLIHKKVYIGNIATHNEFPKHDDFFGITYSYIRKYNYMLMNNIKYKNKTKFVEKKKININLNKIIALNTSKGLKLLSRKNKIKLFKNQIKLNSNQYKIK